MLKDRSYDIPTSIGKFFLRALRSKLIIIENTASIMTVIGKISLVSFNLLPLILSNMITATIPAIAITQRTHQLTRNKNARDSKTPTFRIYKFFRNLVSNLPLLKKGKPAAATIPRALTEPTVLKILEVAKENLNTWTPNICKRP